MTWTVMFVEGRGFVGKVFTDTIEDTLGPIWWGITISAPGMMWRLQGDSVKYITTFLALGYVHYPCQ